MSFGFRLLAIPLVLTAVLATATGAGATGSASTPYSSGTSGYDISYPQCGSAMPAGSFGVVGIDQGRPFDTVNGLGPNPCLANQYSRTPHGALYMNTGYDPSYVTNRQVASCVAASSRKVNLDSAHQQAWEVGCAFAYDNWNYALNSLKLAAPAAWWLDVETDNSWSSDVTLNATTIQGALDELHQLAPAIPVGVYSTGYQWNRIAGATPVRGIDADWVATGASSLRRARNYCGSPFNPGVPGRLVQAVTPYDVDYAC